jgi:hypothetical protein
MLYAAYCCCCVMLRVLLMWQQFCVETMMHLTCTNMPVEKLDHALAEVRMGAEGELVVELGEGLDSSRAGSAAGVAPGLNSNRFQVATGFE